MRNSIAREIPAIGSLPLEPRYHRSGSKIGAKQVPLNHLDNDAASQLDQNAEENFRGQIEAIDRSQMMIEFNMDGTIILANENYLRAFGYTNADIAGKEHSIFVTDEYKRSPAYAKFWETLRGGVFQLGLFVRIDKQGKEVWIEASYNPVLGPDRVPVKVVKFASNVTARMKVHSLLKDAEARVQAILNSVLDGIITIDETGTITSFNPAAARMFGYEEAEVVGKNIKMLMPEPNRGDHDGHLARHQSTSKSKAIGVGRELEGLSKTGRTFPMELTITEMALQGRKFFVGVVRDTSERSRQENALRRSEDLLNRTGRLAGVGGWELDLVTSEVTWSDETRRLHGFENDYVPTLEEGINFYAPEARPVIRTAIEQSMADGKDWEVVVPVIRVDGHRIWARVKGTVQFANGKPVRLVGVFQDVTARVAEAEALENANARTALATESCGIGIWDWDLSCGKFTCDTLIYQLFGLEPECDKRFDLEFWAGRVHREDRPGVEKGLQDCVAGIRPYDIEYRIVWDDGSIHHIKATGKLTRDRDGNSTRVVGTSMDITARKRAEAALRLGNENEKKLIMGVKDFAILMLDPQGIVTTWNEGAERIKGYRADEIVGFHYSKFYPPEAIAEGKPARELQIATETGRFEEEAWRVRKDGTRFWADIVITALFNADGTLRGFGKVTRDISERKTVEAEREKIAAELARYTRALERSNLELDAFAYAASHDLKAPLRVIHNASTWIEEDLAGKLTAEMNENMNLLRSRVHRMDRLLDDLLEYSRIGRETDDGHTEAISGTVLMENIQGLLSPPEGFTVDASSALAGIEVFRMPLQQILINLISNAIKHHDKKAGRIEVSVEDLGADWRFSVKDDGPGIPPQYHEQIFKMFQTLKPRDQVEGSGMGLAMVRKHVDVAGGELRLESAIGQGSTFSFTWPKDNGSTNKTKHKFTRIGETS
jgi:PAS domain S-box-containing protein